MDDRETAGETGQLTSTAHSRHRATSAAGRVIVVGAGISGLAAARKLTAYGFDVVVLEARNRLGGRLWTDRGLGMPLDLGASWIHGKQGNPIAKLAREQRIQTTRSDYGNIGLYDDGGKRVAWWRERLSTAKPLMIMHRLAQLAREVDQDISVAEGIRRMLIDVPLNDTEQRFLHRYMAHLESLNAADLDDQSLFAFARGAIQFNGGDVLFPGGYAQVAEALARDIHVVFEEEVAHIQHSSTGVKITTDRGNHEAEAAVVTLPLGVLQSQSVTFSPVLPASKLAAISKLKMGTFNKVALQFSEPFWPRHLDFIEKLPDSKEPFIGFINWYRYTRQPVLIACTAANDAAALEHQSDTEIVSAVLSVLRRIFGSAVTEPAGVRITRWGQDRYSLGSYSVVLPGVTALDFDALAEPVGRLAFAGEATIAAHQGTVHGAYLSGLRAAAQLREALSNLT